MAVADYMQEQRVLLRHVTWETYERLLQERGEDRSPRYMYDRGLLEIISPISGEHEEYGRNLEHVVRILVAAFGLRLRTFGSMTLRREDIEGGFEADACFYIGNVERVRGIIRPDLNMDPPPDLVVEVDVTNPSFEKLPVYARFGVPEVWRYDGSRMEIFALEGDRYGERAESPTFRGATPEALASLVRDVRFADSDEWERRVREWAREVAGRGSEPAP